MLRGATEFRVEDIARQAGVSVPTLYSHFGSKGGLLAALIGEIERQAGLYAGFKRVWRGRGGGGPPRAVLGTTLRFLGDARALFQVALRGPPVRSEAGSPAHAFA